MIPGSGRFPLPTPVFLGFPGGSEGKESTCNAGDLGLIPGLGRSPGGGHGNPLQYSYLENPMDKGAWRATVHGVAKSRTQLKQLIIHWSHLPFAFVDWFFFFFFKIKILKLHRLNTLNIKREQ